MYDDDIKVSNLRYSEEENGTFFSKSKKTYTWKFVLDGIPRVIVLEHSRLSGKRLIFLDKKQLVHYMKYTYNFSYSFSIDKHNISIQQVGNGYELRIENIPYQTLINRQKLARYNVIREEYIKEHPIIVEPPPKKPEEKKKEEEMAKEFLKERSQLNFQFNKQAQLQEKGLIEEDSDENEEEDNKEEKRMEEENEEGESDDDNVIDNKGKNDTTPVDNPTDRTEENNNVNHFDLLGPEIFNSETGKNVDTNNSNVISNNNVIDLLGDNITQQTEPVKIPESIININQNLNIDELKGIEFK